MAFLASSPGTPAQVAGPLDVAGLIEAYGKLEYGVQFNAYDPLDTIDDSLEVANAAAGMFLGAAVRMLEARTLHHAVLVITPKTLPPVDIPYMVGFSCTASNWSESWLHAHFNTVGAGKYCLQVQKHAAKVSVTGPAAVTGAPTPRWK